MDVCAVVAVVQRALGVRQAISNPLQCGLVYAAWVLSAARCSPVRPELPSLSRAMQPEGQRKTGVGWGGEEGG